MLPQHTPEETFEQPEKRPRRTLQVELQVPDLCFDGIMWQSSSRRVVFRVDCMPLMSICCGELPLLNDDLRPVCHRITNNIVQICETGRSPLRDTAGPVEWRKRDQNKVADFLCNYTMNTSHSWRQTWSLRDDFDIDEANLLIFSDGGSRLTCSVSANMMLIRTPDSY